MLQNAALLFDFSQMSRMNQARHVSQVVSGSPWQNDSKTVADARAVMRSTWYYAPGVRSMPINFATFSKRSFANLDMFATL